MFSPKNRIKNLLLVFLCFLMSISTAFSQEQSYECYTSDPPAKQMFEYAKRLPDIQNSIRSKTTRSVVSNLPMTFTVFRDPNNDNAPTQAQITASINALNQELTANNVDVQFYQHGFINYVDNTELSNMNSDDNDATAGYLYGFLFSASNVYVYSGGGLAGFPCPLIFDPLECEFDDDNKIRVGKTFSDNSIHEQLFVHEVGHHLGLYHIFHGDPNIDPYSNPANGEDWPAELVIRTEDLTKTYTQPNWQFGGDLLQDTEASCVVSSSCGTDSGCNYLGTEDDLNLDLFAPNVDNYMGYFSFDCQNAFTPQQVELLDYYGNYRADKYSNTTNYLGYMEDFIQFEGTEVPWPGVVANLSFPENGTYSYGTSQEDGAFQLEIYTNDAVTFNNARLPPLDGTIAEFEYSWEEWVAGVSTYDVYLIERHVLMLEPLSSGYKQLAADVNQSGDVTSLDNFWITRLVLKVDERFSEPIYPWYFIPEYIPQDNATEFHNNPFGLDLTQSGGDDFPEYVDPFWTYDVVDVNNGKNGYDGIKLGDVSSFTPPEVPGSPSGGAADRDDSNTKFVVPAISLRAGEEIDLQLNVSNYKDIVAFQLGFSVDEKNIEIIDLQKGDLESFDLKLHQKQKDQNAFRTIYVTPNGRSESLLDGSSLYNIRLKAKQSIRDLSEVLKLDNQVLETAFYLHNGAKAKVELGFIPRLKSRDEQTVVDKYYSSEIQVYPNPFDDFLNIKFLAETEGEHLVIIQDLNGKEVWNVKKSFKKGINIFNIPTAPYLPIGVYVVSVESIGGTAQYGKIVKVK